MTNDWPYALTFAVFFVGALARGSATYWAGRALRYGGQHTRLARHLDRPAVVRAESKIGGTLAWVLDPSLPLPLPEQARAVADGAVFGGYDPGRWKTKEDGRPRPIERLRAVLRSAAGVQTQLIMTGNPGGAGQSWVKARYIDPAPRGYKMMAREIDLPVWAARVSG